MARLLIRRRRLPARGASRIDVRRRLYPPARGGIGADRCRDDWERAIARDGGSKKSPRLAGRGLWGNNGEKNPDRLPLDTIPVQRCRFYRKENLQINKELLKPPHRWNSPVLFTVAVAAMAIQLCETLLAFQLFLPPVGQVLPGLRHPLKHMPLVFLS